MSVTESREHSPRGHGHPGNRVEKTSKNSHNCFFGFVIKIFKLIARLGKQIDQTLKIEDIFENLFKLGHLVLSAAHAGMNAYQTVIGSLGNNAPVLDIVDELEIICSNLWDRVNHFN